MNPIDDKVLDNSDDEVPDLVEIFDEASKDEVIDIPVQEQLTDASEAVVFNVLRCHVRKVQFYNSYAKKPGGTYSIRAR